jgi:hypothetical protein
MREETSISEDGSRSDALLGTAAWCLALAALILVASSVVQVIGYEGARFSDRFYLAAANIVTPSTAFLALAAVLLVVVRPSLADRRGASFASGGAGTVAVVTLLASQVHGANPSRCRGAR